MPPYDMDHVEHPTYRLSQLQVGALSNVTMRSQVDKLNEALTTSIIPIWKAKMLTELFAAITFPSMIAMSLVNVTCV
jgi:hypothetical protein